MIRQAARHRFRELEEPTINLTPLIDVVFVLLITFMIVAPLLDIDRVDLAESPITVEKAYPFDPSHIAIHVHADQSIWLNKRQVNLNELKTLLVEAKTAHPHQHPQLIHDKQAPFGLYQSIKNVVQEVGFTDLDVILKPA